MFVNQLTTNFLLFILSLNGLIKNRQNILIIIMAVELLLLSLNLNFIIFAVYLDDLYGQIFSFFVLTVAATESAVGLAIIIVYYRLRGNLIINEKTFLRG